MINVTTSNGTTTEAPVRVPQPTRLAQIQQDWMNGVEDPTAVGDLLGMITDAKLDALFGPATPETQALIAASIVAHSLPERERTQLAELAGGV